MFLTSPYGGGPNICRVYFVLYWAIGLIIKHKHYEHMNKAKQCTRVTDKLNKTYSNVHEQNDISDVEVIFVIVLRRLQRGRMDDPRTDFVTKVQTEIDVARPIEALLPEKLFPVRTVCISLDLKRVDVLTRPLLLH